MADLIIDGCAHALRESFIAKRRRDSAHAGRLIIYPLIDLLGCDASLDMLSHIIQNCHIDLAALADPLDLLRGLDHVVIRNLVSGIRRLHQLLIKCLMAMFVLLSTSTPAQIISS